MARMIHCRDVLTAAAVACGIIATTAPRARSQQDDPPLGALDHTVWTIRDGAPAGTHVITQAADGVLWLGTMGGLYRFDGVRFERFEPRPPQTLPSLSIGQLLALPDSTLWIGFVFGGVSVLTHGQVVNYRVKDGIPLGALTALARDSVGDIWAATTTGLAHLHGGRWQRVGAESGYPASGMTSDLVVDRRGKLWAATSQGVFALARGESRFAHEGPPLDKNGSGYGAPRLSPDGSVWSISTTRGLVRLTDSAGNAVALRPAVAGLDTVFNMLVDHKGYAWMDTPAGLMRVRLTTSARQSGMPLSPQKVPIASGEVAGESFEDRDGNVWVATANGIERFRETKLTPTLLPSPQIPPSVVAAADGAVWIGGYGAALLASGDRLISHPEGPVEISCAYRDFDGGLWFGGTAGMWHAPPTAFPLDTRFTRVPLPKESGPGEVQAIARTLTGDLWVSIRGGRKIGVFRRRHGEWSIAPLPSEFSNQYARTVVADSAGRVWLGYTDNRLVSIDGDSVRVFTEREGLHVATVTTVVIRGTRTWIGGEFGVALLESGRIREITAVEPFVGISGLVETEVGDLWLNGTSGVTHIAATEVRRAVRDSTYSVKSEQFDDHDGLVGRATLVRPVPTTVQGTDGRLWFTTERGLAWVDPRRIRRNLLPPPVQIRAVHVADKRYAAVDRVTLPPRTTQLQIVYTALDLGMPDRVRFRYRLVGADTAWTEAGNRREAFYTNLRPGSYRFHVIAANEDGIWNESGAGVAIEIPPTFTQTRMFLLLVGGSIVGFAWLLVIWRRHQIARAEEALGKLRSELAHVSRATSLGTLTASIAHEVNQPLSGIVTNASTCLRMLAANPPNLDGARETVQRLIRDGNRASDTIVRLRALFSRKSPVVEPFDLADATHEVIALSRTELQRARATVQLELAEDVPPAMGDRIQLQQVIINLLRNACDAMSSVNDRPRAIVIRTWCGTDDDICLSVRDSGVGFAPEDAEKFFQAFHTTKNDGMGIGLSVSRAIIESHQGRLWASSHEGPGATFSFSIPLRPDKSLAAHVAERYQSIMDRPSSTGIT